MGSWERERVSEMRYLEDEDFRAILINSDISSADFVIAESS